MYCIQGLEGRTYRFFRAEKILSIRPLVTVDSPGHRVKLPVLLHSKVVGDDSTIDGNAFFLPDAFYFPIHGVVTTTHLVWVPKNSFGWVLHRYKSGVTFSGWNINIYWYTQYSYIIHRILEYFNLVTKFNRILLVQNVLTGDTVTPLKVFPAVDCKLWSSLWSAYDVDYGIHF